MKKFNMILSAGVLAAISIPVFAGLGGSAESGLPVGGKLPAFEPTHVSGPDKGTDTCPVCKYGARPAVQVWVTGDSVANVERIAKALDAAVAKNSGKEMKAFVIWTNSTGAAPAKLAETLSGIAKKDGLKNVALTYLPNKNDEAISAYGINSKVKNTVFVYKDRTVVKKFVDLMADERGLKSLDAAINTIVK